MPFFLRYRMLSGTSKRVADTPQEALAAIADIQEAGGSLIAIMDGTGHVCSLDQLRADATPETGAATQNARPSFRKQQ